MVSRRRGRDGSGLVLRRYALPCRLAVSALLQESGRGDARFLIAILIASLANLGPEVGRAETEATSRAFVHVYQSKREWSSKACKRMDSLRYECQLDAMYEDGVFQAAASRTSGTSYLAPQALALPAAVL